MKTYLDARVDFSLRENPDWISETKALFRQYPFLMYSGLGQVILFVVALFLMQIDDRTVLGINTWIKPAKFLLSGGVYLLTMGWVLSHLSAWDQKKSRRIGRMTAWLMNLEIGLIVMQGARGVQSHFNTYAAFDGWVFRLMGVLILISTYYLIRVCWISWRKTLKTPKPMLWAIRLGLLLMILSSFEGGAMIQANQHTVGVADGGAGIAFLNWSTEGGDLRIAHFFGMHGIQLFALFAFFIQTRSTRATQWVIGIAVGYGFLSLGTFVHAMMGYPLF